MLLYKKNIVKSLENNLSYGPDTPEIMDGQMHINHPVYPVAESIMIKNIIIIKWRSGYSTVQPPKCDVEPHHNRNIM